MTSDLVAMFWPFLKLGRKKNWKKQPLLDLSASPQIKISLPHARIPFQSAAFMVENKKSTQLIGCPGISRDLLVKPSNVKVSSLLFTSRLQRTLVIY